MLNTYACRAPPHGCQADGLKIERVVSPVSNEARNSQSLINVNVSAMIKKSLKNNGSQQPNSKTQNNDFLDAYENAVIERQGKQEKQKYSRNSFQENSPGFFPGQRVAKTSSKKNFSSCSSQPSKEEHLLKLLNLQNEAEMAAFKILRKGEDINYRRKKDSKTDIFRREITNIPQAKEKNKATTDLMKLMRQKKKQSKKQQGINESLMVVVGRNQSRMGCSSTTLSSSIALDQLSIQNAQKIKRKEEFDRKVEKFIHELSQKPFLQVYDRERRKTTNKAFLEATRKFNINKMDDIKDPNVFHQLTKGKKKSHQDVKHSSRGSFRSSDGKKEEKENMWEGDKNFLTNLMNGKAIQQACILKLSYGNGSQDNRFSSIN